MFRGANIVGEECERTRLRVCEVRRHGVFRRTGVEGRRSEVHYLWLSRPQEDQASRCETGNRQIIFTAYLTFRKFLFPSENCGCWSLLCLV